MLKLLKRFYNWYRFHAPEWLHNIVGTIIVLIIFGILACVVAGISMLAGDHLFQR